MARVKFLLKAVVGLCALKKVCDLTERIILCSEQDQRKQCFEGSSNLSGQLNPTPIEHFRGTE